MQRYFVNKIESNTFTLNNDDSYHLGKVMRAKEKDLVEIIYKEETYICKVDELIPFVKCSIIEKKELKEDFIPKVTIAQSLVKEQKMDYVLQKSTELGVDKIIPLRVKRSIIKLDKNDNKKIDRWQKIVHEASEQSKRVSIPKVENISDISDLIKFDYDYKILCSVNEMSTTLKRGLQNISKSDTILIVIGPEGGFDPSEEEMLINNGFTSVSLGSRVLRTETVSSFVLGVINYIFEE